MNAIPLRRRAALLALCAASLIALPALAETVRGNGVVRSQQRAASGFTGVALALPAKVEVRLGPTESVTLEADENLLPLIETTVRRGTLEIKATRNNLSLDSHSIHVVVQAKAIDRIDLGGSGNVVADALKGGDLQLNIGGSGSVEVKRADVERVAVSIGGSGSAKVAGGAAKRLKVSIGGSGEADTQGLVSDDAEITVAGSGNVHVAARTALAITIAGSGDITYFGDPPTMSRTVVGSGRVKRGGPLPQ